MKRIAFLTLENPEGFVIYDSLCIPFFEKLGIQVIPIPWTKKKEWSNYDLVVIRSPWDYQQKWSEFIHVLKTIQSQTLLANSLETVLWNVNKTYLRALKEHMFPVIPSVFLDTIISPKDYQSVISNFNNPYLVIKPQISANSDNTYIIESYKDYKHLKIIFENKPYILQPFLESIENEGEISLIYFNGEYSHAVKKTPKPDDFRVQEEHGGRIQPFNAPDDLLAIANSVIQYLNNRLGLLLYARIDLVRKSDKWLIMEVELIEPSLYFPYYQDACKNFVRATLKWYEIFSRTVI